MEQKPEVPEQTAVIAQRVKEVRTKRGWSAERLAQEMRGAGIAWNRGVVAKLEKGWRRDVSVAELLALSRVLQCAPVHLIVPPGAETYEVMPGLTAPAEHVRDWIRGYGLLPGDDLRLYLGELPAGEAEEIGGVAFPKRVWPVRQPEREGT